MGANYSVFYYDIMVKNTPYPEHKRSSLYRYAYFLDKKDSMLYRQGYDVETDCKNLVYHKAYQRAILERYPEIENDNLNNFLYIISLPNPLLKNCEFQNRLNLYYDKNIIDWALEYKGVKNCYS